MNKPNMKLITSEDYVNSLKDRPLKVYLFGELVDDRGIKGNLR